MFYFERKSKTPLYQQLYDKIRIYSLSPFWTHQSNCSANQFLLGYGSIPLVELPLAMSAIRAVIEQIDRNDTPLR